MIIFCIDESVKVSETSPRFLFLYWSWHEVVKTNLDCRVFSIVWYFCFLKISPVKLVKEPKKNFLLQASIYSLQPKGAGRKDKGREVQANTLSLLRRAERPSQGDAECKGKNQLLMFPPIIWARTEILVFLLSYETNQPEVVVITLLLAVSLVGGGIVLWVHQTKAAAAQVSCQGHRMPKGCLSIGLSGISLQHAYWGLIISGLKWFQCVWKLEGAVLSSFWGLLYMANV